jgi:CRISPR-associated endonuclease/helicase Cas3
MAETYSEFFCRVTKRETILPYQQRYGENPFSHTLLVIPTGLGKTDTVLLPWLFAHRQGNKQAPTRMIFVLPRQNLTSQTARIARERVTASGFAVGEIKVLELMGGSADNREDLQQDQRSIVVATQDLYFSRALNRGYARRPPRWPIDFALYNQDCLIVLDEIQLMGDALATSTQLATFREEFGTVGNAVSVWMSATVNPAWLRTVDFKCAPNEIRLDSEDLKHPLVIQRTHAAKSVQLAPESCRTPSGCAEFAIQRHSAGTRTLVIANTVQRAREIFLSIRSAIPDAILLHSRFRPADRKAIATNLGSIPDKGQIVVATQVLEAGVDITSRLLVTDVAPWGSLVQRFGRVNRYGEETSSEIWWVDQPTHSKLKEPSPLPYSSDEIQSSILRINNLTSASPSTLMAIAEDGSAPWQHVLRRSDLLDLFDTTADLSGNEIDVSRFIRASDDKDVYLAWREENDFKNESVKDFSDDELCPVPIGELREFLKKHKVWTWNYVTEEWEVVDRERLYPGMMIVTACNEGGYDLALGWHPESKARVLPVVPDSPGKPLECDTSDTPSFTTYRQRLRDHSNRVAEEMEALLHKDKFLLDEECIQALHIAALNHDWGKAHECFQETLHRNDGPKDDSKEILAKQKGNGRHRRKHLRHELASALATLQSGESDLTAYLVAAHHGKVRMGIRSMPGEQEENGVPTARGIREGERLPALELAPGLWKDEIQLSLAHMKFGAEGGSWTDRMLRLRDRLGPFRLAYLEALVRTADIRASNDPQLEVEACTS